MDFILFNISLENKLDDEWWFNLLPNNTTSRRNTNIYTYTIFSFMFYNVNFINLVNDSQYYTC